MLRADAPFLNKQGRENYKRRVHVCSDVTGSAVSLTESRMTYEMGPWECLIGIVLVVIIEKGRPTLLMVGPFPFWRPGLNKVEKQS